MRAFDENTENDLRVIVLSADYSLNSRLQKKLQKEGFLVIGFYDVDDAIEWETEHRTVLKFYVIDAISRDPHWKAILDSFHANDLIINCMLFTDREHIVSDDEVNKHDVRGVYVFKDDSLDQLGDELRVCICGAQNNDDVSGDNRIPRHQPVRREPDLADEVISIGRSIKARKENAQMLNERNSDRSSIYKGATDLLANLSNDITEPLNTMIVMARDLEKTALSKEQHNLLKSIIAAAGNLRNVFNNALDYVSLETNRPEVVYHNFHLAVLLEESLLLIKPQVDSKNIEIHLNIGQNVPEYVFGDKSKVQQVLTHVFSHLIKAFENISIELSVQAVLDKAFGKTLGFVFKTSRAKSATDGISDRQSMLAHASIADDQNFGIGIRIAKALVEVMGGELMIERQAGQPLAMSFSIPLMESFVSGVAEGPSPDDSTTKKELKMLLAEDDVINQLYLAGFLRMQGWEVDTAYNGLTVMELFKPGKYDLIILDGQMPVMDGFETAENIRLAEGDDVHTPILAISGFATPGDKQRFLDAGMDDYIPKPINEDELLHVIHMLTS